MTTQSPTPAGWYADPQGTPHQLRWWDGNQWTQHTHPGQAGHGAAQQPVPAQPEKIQRQVQQQAQVGPTAQGGGTLFTEPVLVVNQKVKLIELTNEYSVYDQHGQTLGSVVQVGQSVMKKVARFATSLDQFMTHRLEIRDAHGQPHLVMTRPAKVLKSKVLIERPNGQPVGEIHQQNVFGKIRFAIMADGRQVGAIKAENWRAWNFAIVDHNDREIARITKTWEGFAKTMFTTADNYVLQIHERLPDPLLSLVIATALTVDTALKQDARGFG